MEEILESIFADEEMPVLYATFWQRLGAVIIDGLIFSLIIPLNIYNETSGKSPALLLASAAITILYKPFCEYKYGATVGKMALKIVVTNKAYQKPRGQEAILRNIFQIIFAALNLVVTLLVFANPQFKAATTFAAYATLRNQLNLVNLITFSICIVYLIDAIFLMADQQKRSLHDRIAATFVVRR